MYAGYKTIVATCVANNVDPQKYLSDVLIRIQTHPQSRLDELLPNNWKPPSDGVVESESSMEDSFCVSALERAIRRFGTPEIFNTDQGAQFTGKAFTDVLKNHGIKISMDGKGRALDNVMVERLWRSVKYEEIYLHEYASVSDLRRRLEIYFRFYNTERPHDAFGEGTPAEAYPSERPHL